VRERGGIAALLVGVEDAQGITCGNWPLFSSSSSSQIGRGWWLLPRRR
jgi:hypothetical protein